MPKEVTIIRYQTDDGRYFETMREAEQHEVRAALEDIISGDDRRWGRGDAPDLNELVDRLVVNAPTVIRLLQRFVEPTEAMIEARKTVEIQDIVLSQRGKV